MKNIKVENMTSSKGNTVANQFRIITPEGVYFQSYSSTIAFKDNAGKVTLDKNKWDYSVTTGKYRNKFLGEGVADTRNNIAAGVYALADLN